MVALCIVASGCRTASVRHLEPHSYPIHRFGFKCMLAPFAPVQQGSNCQWLFAEANERERNCDPSCVDLYFQVAAATCGDDGPANRNCPTRVLHKAALAKLVAASQQFQRLDLQQGLRLESDGHSVRIPIALHGFVWNPSEIQRIEPIGEYTTRAIKNIHRFPGVGIPLVATAHTTAAHPFLTRNSVFAATLRMKVHGQNARDGGPLQSVSLELYDPLRMTRTVGDLASVNIIRDLTAPLAYRLDSDPQTILDDFINPGSATGQSRLRTLEPYQPNKIPVVFIHGLLSNPYTWADMVNDLQAQPGFVDRFQVWVFEYPTGQSFLSSAAELRRQLREARTCFDPMQKDPKFSDMVLVGHSMGGLIAKLQITSSGEQLWRSIANRPVEQVTIPGRIRSSVVSSFFFEPSKDVSRVIYLGTPHRGSLYSRRIVGRVGSALVSVPEERVVAHRELIERNPNVFTKEVSQRIPTSIDLLEPASELLQAIHGLPIAPYARMHSIIGTSRQSLLFGASDGVVSVESAREGLELSERFVESTHAKLTKHPESIREVSLLLDCHWRESLSHKQPTGLIGQVVYPSLVQ